MQFQAIVLATLLGRFAAQPTQPAPIISNNVPDTAYVASLTSGPGKINGSIVIAAQSNGNGVNVDIRWDNFDLDESREYTYHIHQKPVPVDGSCNSTLAHLDKYNVTDDFVCDPSKPELCQLGDLSGKHGAIKFENNTNTVRLQYADDYLSTDPNNAAYFGDLSIVVHKKSNKLRLNCGNFSALILSNSSTISTSATATFPNATTSTEIVATSSEAPSEISVTSTSTTVVQATASEGTSHTSHSSAGSPSSTGSVQSGSGNIRRRFRHFFITIVIEGALLLGLA